MTVDELLSLFFLQNIGLSNEPPRELNTVSFPVSRSSVAYRSG